MDHVGHFENCRTEISSIKLTYQVSVLSPIVVHVHMALWSSKCKQIPICPQSSWIGLFRFLHYTMDKNILKLAQNIDSVLVEI